MLSMASLWLSIRWRKTHCCIKSGFSRTIPLLISISRWSTCLLASAINQPIPVSSVILGNIKEPIPGKVRMCFWRNFQRPAIPKKSSPSLQLVRMPRSSRPFETKPKGSVKESIVIISAANSLHEIIRPFCRKWTCRGNSRDFVGQHNSLFFLCLLRQSLNQELDLVINSRFPIVFQRTYRPLRVSHFSSANTP